MWLVTWDSISSPNPGSTPQTWSNSPAGNTPPVCPLDVLTGGSLAFDWKVFLLPPAAKLGQGNIFRRVCQQFCPRGGMCGCSRGVHGCSGGMYVVARGGHAWLLWGGVHGCSRGHAWLLWGVCMVAPGGMRGCLGGMRGCLGVCVVPSGGGGLACMVTPRGVHGCSRGHAWLLWLVHGCSQGHAWLLPGRGACVGYDEIRRYDQWAGGTHSTGMHSC